MNIEHPTLNAEHRRAGDGSKTHDLEERLLEYSVRIIRLVEALPNTRAGRLPGFAALGSPASLC
jgi:hypothetical protein